MSTLVALSILLLKLVSKTRMFGIDFQDYTPIPAIMATLRYVKFFLLYMAGLVIITSALASYMFVQWAVSVPTWIAILVIWGASAFYFTWSAPTPAKLVKVAEIYVPISIDDFTIINRYKEQILAAELARLMASCKMDTMRISGSVVPVSDCQTLINQVD